MRLRAFLGMWSVLLAAVGVTIVASGRLDEGSRAGDQTIDAGDTPRPSTPGDGVPAPGPGQVRVTGLVTALHLDGAVLSPREIATPLTVTSNRGFGNGGDVTQVEVDGRPSTIAWDGGRPFVLAEGPALIPDPAVIDLTPEGLRIALGGGAHRFGAGTYRIDTPVAVGASGVATPRDQVTFTASARSTFAARGDAAVIVDRAMPRRLVGPGRVELTGTLELTDQAGTRTTSALTVDRTAFDLVLTPTPDGGWSVEGLLDAGAVD